MFGELCLGDGEQLFALGDRILDLIEASASGEGIDQALDFRLQLFDASFGLAQAGGHLMAMRCAAIVIGFDGRAYRVG
ncbi:hypothetical protein [Sphingomonas sp.]|uniref:hypothetical protein n=1 Tax=Sphingomonas sp. TaxID=28214 RepID=UPI002E0DB84C|nr:hypothetical protein [Sphingomonas sp.]